MNKRKPTIDEIEQAIADEGSRNVRLEPDGSITLRVEQLRADNERLVDALDHISRTCRGSRTQTRRLRWIAARAVCAIEGKEDWRDLDVPVTDPLIDKLRDTIKLIFPVVQAELVNLLDNYSTLSAAERERATFEAILASINERDVHADCVTIKEFLRQARFNVPEINVNELRAGEEPVDLQNDPPAADEPYKPDSMPKARL